jgi:hypothetical protein
VKNSESTQLLGAANGIPIYFALSVGGGVFGGPKEGPLNLVDELYGAKRDVEGSEVVDCLGGNDRLDLGGPTGRGNELSIPSW